jgi:hypothetical protein
MAKPENVKTGEGKNDGRAVRKNRKSEELQYRQEAELLNRSSGIPEIVIAGVSTN